MVILPPVYLITINFLVSAYAPAVSRYGIVTMTHGFQLMDALVPGFQLRERKHGEE